MSEPDVFCSHTEMRATESLVEHPRNYNTHPKDQINLLAKIIRHQGWRNPITVSARSGFVVKGHGRLAAARLLECESVPVDVQEYKDEASEYADMIADNRIAELAEADQDALKGLLTDDVFEGFDLDLTGFGDLDFLNEDIDNTDLNDDSENAEELIDQGDILHQKWGTKLGQIWQLGDHRLMCGDSTNEKHVSSLMDGEKADLCFTSPPYGLGESVKLSGNKSMSHRSNAYTDHQDDPKTWRKLMDDWFSASFQSVNDCWLINVQPLAGNKRELLKFISENSTHLADIVTWDKGHAAPPMANGVMASRYEWLIVFSSKKKASRAIPLSSWRGTIQSVYQAPPQRNNEYSKIHAATMPTHFPEWALGQLCDKSKSVYEPFCGSGSTLIACEQLNRKCYAMEISPQYVAVALQRWHDMTNQDPVLIETIDC